MHSYRHGHTMPLQQHVGLAHQNLRGFCESSASFARKFCIFFFALRLTPHQLHIMPRVPFVSSIIRGGHHNPVEFEFQRSLPHIGKIPFCFEPTGMTCPCQQRRFFFLPVLFFIFFFFFFSLSFCLIVSFVSNVHLLRFSSEFSPFPNPLDFTHPP